MWVTERWDTIVVRGFRIFIFLDQSNENKIKSVKVCNALSCLIIILNSNCLYSQSTSRLRSSSVFVVVGYWDRNVLAGPGATLDGVITIS
jgi:hypothetical protein